MKIYDHVIPPKKVNTHFARWLPSKANILTNGRKMPVRSERQAQGPTTWRGPQTAGYRSDKVRSERFFFFGLRRSEAFFGFSGRAAAVVGRKKQLSEGRTLTILHSTGSGTNIEPKISPPRPQMKILILLAWFQNGKKIEPCCAGGVIFLALYLFPTRYPGKFSKGNRTQNVKKGTSA